MPERARAEPNYDPVWFRVLSPVAPARRGVTMRRSVNLGTLECQFSVVRTRSNYFIALSCELFCVSALCACPLCLFGLNKVTLLMSYCRGA